MGCPYKNLFGAPGTGPHAYRFMGLAVVDTGLTILAAWIASWWVGGFTFLQYFLILLVIGEVLHYIFGVNTALLNTFGLQPGECS